MFLSFLYQKSKSFHKQNDVSGSVWLGGKLKVVRHSLLIALHAPDFISPSRQQQIHINAIYKNTCTQYTQTHTSNIHKHMHAIYMNTHKRTNSSKQKLQLCKLTQVRQTSVTSSRPSRQQQIHINVIYKNTCTQYTQTHARNIHECT